MTDSATQPGSAASPHAFCSGIDRTIHPKDAMSSADEGRYLRLGAEALGLICTALSLAHAPPPLRVLDFASGFGRVARHLRVAFPDAELVCADVWAEAVAFTRRFADRAVRVRPDGEDWPALGGEYGLIWCGSLLTHLPEPGARAVIDLFDRALAPGGVAVFTTHGRFVRHRLASGQAGYGVEDPAPILAGFDRTEHAFAPYPGQEAYGASATPLPAVLAWIQQRDGLTVRMVCERGWDDHQDVVAFQKRAPDAPWINRAAEEGSR